MSVYQKLLAAKLRFEPLKKSGRNPHFGSEFSTLSDMHAACFRGLSEMGLVMVQFEEVVELGGHVTAVQVTELVDTEDGEKLSSRIPLPHTDNPQVMGSNIRYYRRYQMEPMLGLDGELDDDGEKAVAPAGRDKSWPRGKPAAAQVPAAVATKSQAPRARPLPQDAMDGMKTATCPNCSGPMWDNREAERGGTSKFPKKNPKAPDFSCKDKGCIDAHAGAEHASVWWTNEWQKLCDTEMLKQAAAEADSGFAGAEEVTDEPPY